MSNFVEMAKTFRQCSTILSYFDIFRQISKIFTKKAWKLNCLSKNNIYTKGRLPGVSIKTPGKPSLISFLCEVLHFYKDTDNFFKFHKAGSLHQNRITVFYITGNMRKK